MLNGEEKVFIELFLSSIIIGEIIIDKVEIDLEKVLKDLGDQKHKNKVFVSENETGFELILRWRYDETLHQMSEI